MCNSYRLDNQSSRLLRLPGRRVEEERGVRGQDHREGPTIRAEGERRHGRGLVRDLPDELAFGIEEIEGAVAALLELRGAGEDLAVRAEGERAVVLKLLAGIGWACGS